MKWHTLDKEEQLAEIIRHSSAKPQLIFKYSTRCSISSVVKQRLDRKETSSVDFHFLDLIAFRPLSNKIAETFAVEHESPQVLLIVNGKCVYHESHMGIRMDEILAQAI